MINPRTVLVSFLCLIASPSALGWHAGAPGLRGGSTENRLLQRHKKLCRKLPRCKKLDCIKNPGGNPKCKKMRCDRIVKLPCPQGAALKPTQRNGGSTLKLNPTRKKKADTGKTNDYQGPPKLENGEEEEPPSETGEGPQKGKLEPHPNLGKPWENKQKESTPEENTEPEVPEEGTEEVEAPEEAVESAPSEPGPEATEPEPEASEPEATEPEPEATEPEPQSTEPEPEATEPEPEATEPEPEATEPEPEATEPEPEATEPEPEATEPEPEMTEPESEPTEPEPEPTEPESTEPVVETEPDEPELDHPDW